MDESNLPAPVTTSGLSWTSIPVTKLLDKSDEDIDLKLSLENESSVNTGNDQDLMNFNTGVLPHVVESLAETVGQVDLRGQESG